MYKKILLPIDGSKLAECVLPHVKTVIAGCSAPDLILLTVVELPSLPVMTMKDASYADVEQEALQVRRTITATKVKEAEEYLGVLAEDLKNTGAQVSPVVLTGDTALKIAEFAEKNDIDLIMIATHGRSGVSRWVWGNTADKILKASCVPVFVVRAPGCIPGF